MGVCLQFESRNVSKEKAQEEIYVKKVGAGIFFLSVSVGEDGRWRGELKHLYHEEPFYFSDLAAALLRMEEILDEYMPPRSPSPIRHFENGKEERGRSVPGSSLPNESGRERRKKKEMFYIEVHYRQNSSWQGEIRWQNGRQRLYFRSGLELLSMLDSALKGGWAARTD